MEFAILCTKINFLVFLLAFSSPSIFIQSPMDFGPLNLLHTTNTSSLDFGRIYFNTPSAVLRPQSPEEISHLLSFLSSSSSSKVTVAAKGAGHSINGQAQALKGIVIEMDALPPSIKIHKGGDGKGGGDDNDDEISYVDVSAGVLWVELLKETLKVGLAPRSWTDYLYLTIGGTLSNGGISGQTFKHGPQISNVLQLDVVTGKGELVTCSPTETPELFYSVLGGLGQFGIITSARILLQKAPQNVKWVRAFYDDFEKFIKDQELLVVSMADKVDYVEGFIVLNEEALLSSSIAFPANLSSVAPKLFPKGSTTHLYYCIEFAVNDQPDKQDLDLDQVVEDVLDKLSFMPSIVHSVEIVYFDFLNRVRMEELYLRGIGLWDVPHPWLNMFLPKPGVTKFRDLLLETLSSTAFEGPILIYPILRDKWDAKASAILPETTRDEGGEEEGGQVAFVVGLLRSVNPSTCTEQCLEQLIRQNGKITEIATDPKMGIGAKLYLPHYTKQEQWREHFGGKWERLLVRKSKYDPLNILAPGQSIFTRKSNNKSKARGGTRTTDRLSSQ